MSFWVEFDTFLRIALNYDHLLFFVAISIFEIILAVIAIRIYVEIARIRWVYMIIKKCLASAIDGIQLLKSTE